MAAVTAGQVIDLALAEEKSDIVKCAEEAQKQPSAEQLRKLRLMVNDPAFSDVVFLCHDRKRVQASRMLLAGTSEVLKSMLTNGMAESSLAEIEMPEISSPVMLAVVEFLYTATLLDHQPKSWRMACEVIIASKFFLLPNLEMITTKFMHSLTSAVVEDLPRAASMLTEGVALKTLCDNTDVNLRELVTILSSNLSDAMYVKNLSEDAFDYLLKNSGENHEDDGKLSLTEYLRFRQVIRWWVFISGFRTHATEELLTVIAPDENRALSLCSDRDNGLRMESLLEHVTCPEQELNCWRADEASRKSAMRLISNIDCQCIPSVLLARVVDALKSKLVHGVAESSASEMEMPEISTAEISTPGLLAVFEFLFTDSLFDHQPRTWRMACEVKIASKFFLLPNLETITRKFMHSLTSAVVEDLPRAASMLTEAVALQSLSDNADCENADWNLMEYVTILSSNLSDAMYVKDLSEDAFDYLLRNSDGLYEGDGKLSFKEYLLFRQVTRWWIYQSDIGSHATEELLTFVAPDEKGALSLCRNPNNLEVIEIPRGDIRLANDWFCWQRDKVSRKSAVRLMSHIDCDLISPALLMKVVEPLKVVSKDEIRKAFRSHALQRPVLLPTPMLLETVECCWEHGKSYSTLNQGYVIQKTQDTVGLAVMTASMSRSYGIHQWHFMLEECSQVFAEMGFMYYSSEKPELDGVTLSDLFVARVLKFHGDQVSASMEATYGSVVWKVLLNGLSTWKVPVVFNYNAFKHTCSLSSDGKDLGIMWEHLPSQVYYPAVSLGTTSRGRVRFELLSGFDIL